MSLGESGFDDLATHIAFCAPADGAAALMFACAGEMTDGGGMAASSALLSWDAPSTNADGTQLTDLVGYRVKRRSTAGAPYTRTLPTEIWASWRRRSSDVCLVEWMA